MATKKAAPAPSGASKFLPVKKVTVGTIAGSAVFMILYGVKETTGYEFTGEAGSAITVLATFGMSYLVKA
jgi:MFS superfamily sulfate permease-like transporter